MDDSINETEKPLQESSRKRNLQVSSNLEENMKRLKLHDVTVNISNRDVIPLRENTYSKTGLVDTLHGVIYQLKLQMLFLKRALDKQYEFNLGTEVEDAEKFDDIVFKYKRNGLHENKEICFVQIKHKQNESNKITIGDLLKSYNSSDNDFSLAKYFMSYCHINKKTIYSDYEIKQFILYTNIDFDNLGSIKQIEFEESDDILEINKSVKTSRRIMLDVPKGHKLYKILKQTSELNILVNTLKSHMESNKTLQLNNHILQLYHVALCKHVFSIQERTEINKQGKEKKVRFATFRDDFCGGKNLSEEVLIFRRMLSSTFKTENITFCEKLRRTEIKISLNFGKLTEPISSKSKLPSDEIEDKDIEDFLKTIVFAVNQPNENELGKLITEELGTSNKFNLLDADTVSDSFQRRMLDWFKEKRPEKGKEGIWLTPESGRELFDSISDKIDCLKAIGISLVYVEKLASFGITFRQNSFFKKLKEFLCQENVLKKILHLVTPGETLLSAIRLNNAMEILKTIPEFQEFESNDSCIFISLDMLRGEKIQQYIIKAFTSKHNYHLLIIECSSTAFSFETFKLFMKLSEILSSARKKIILISEKDNVLLDVFANDIKLCVEDSASFIDLTDESKDNILGKAVTFQGHCVSLNKLINKTDEICESIIDLHVMLKLLKEEEIKINNLQQRLGDVNDYYINRKFRQVIFSEDKINKYLKENNSHKARDIFVLHGKDSGIRHRYLYEFDDSIAVERKFIELCDKYVNSNIHWMEIKSGNIVWHKSYGTISHILKCRINDNEGVDFKPLPLLDEEHFLCKENSRNNIYIISDTAGMGKSILLSHLSMGVQSISNNLWLNRINLNDHSTRLEKELNSRHKEQNILLKDLLLSQDQSVLEKKLFDWCVLKNGQGILFFDGFDEICPDYESIVIDLFKSLTKSKVLKVFIATRPNCQEILERSLGTFAYTLEPLSKKEQIDFLTKFWTAKLKLSTEDEIKTKRLEIYVNSVIEHVSQSISRKEQDFIGIPLQIMMLAEVFQENQIELPVEWQSCKEFLESSFSKPKLPHNYALLHLYKHFVEKKFYTFHLQNKKGRKLAITGEKEKAHEDFTKFKANCAMIALKTLLSENMIMKLLSEAEIQQLNTLIDFYKQKMNEGMIDQFRDDKPQFVHRTFAEYFASFSIADKMFTNPLSTLECVDHVILNMSPVFVSSIIDELNGKQNEIASVLKQPLFHFVVEKKYTNLMKVLVQIQPNVNNWPSKLDIMGKTPLHYAIEHECYDIAEKLLNYVDDIYEKDILKHGELKKPEYENSRLVSFINSYDKEENTALNYACQKTDLDFAFKLLLKGASTESLTGDEVNKLIVTMLKIKRDCSIEDNGILAVYANQDNKYRPVQEKLLLKSPFIFNSLSEKDQCRILSYFFVHGRLKVIDSLLGTVPNLEERKKILNNPDNSSTPLDRVNGSDHLSVDERLAAIKYLEEYDAVGMGLSSYSGNYISEILEVAAQNGSLNTFKSFITKEDKGNYHRHFYVACKCNQIEIVTYLLENHKDFLDINGNTVLHSACDSGACLKIVKHVIHTTNINAKNENNETPLFMALYERSGLNVIDYLVKKGADINCEDIEGNRPLYYAVEKNMDDIISYLLKNGAQVSQNCSQVIKSKIKYFSNPDKYDLDLVDSDGFPRVHRAIRAGDFVWATFLIQRGADVNKIDAEGKTPLHYACAVKNTELVELLLQNSAMFDIKDKNGMRPQDFCPQNISDSKIFWLLNVLDQLFKSENFYDKLQKLLLDKNENIMPNWGPYGSGHPDAWDSNNPMLFILNARNSKRKSLLHLAAADILLSADILLQPLGCKALDTLLKFSKEYSKDIKSIRCQNFKPLLIDQKDSEGNSPLHIAAQTGYTHVSRILREGPIFNEKNLQQQTPEMIALGNEHNHTVEILQVISRLFISLQNGNYREFVNHIEKYKYNGCINTRNECGKTLLHLSASLGKLGVVKFLIDNNADIEALDSFSVNFTGGNNTHKNTVLHYAVQNNHVKIVWLLLTQGVIYDTKNSQGLRPVDLISNESSSLLNQVDKSFVVIKSDEPEIIVKNLIKYSENCEIDVISAILNARDSCGNTLLHYASEFGEYNVVKFLLENGACYNIENNNKHTPFRSSNKNIVTLLETVENLFKNIRDIHQEQTVNMEILRNVRNSSRKGLLYYAAEDNSLETVKFLVENGASVNLTEFDYSYNERVQSLIFKDKAATLADKLEIMRYLIDNGDVSTTNEKGETPLMVAINDKAHIDVIKYLVAKGSDVNCTDAFGFTPLSCAERRNCKDIRDFLLTKKARSVTCASTSN